MKIAPLCRAFAEHNSSRKTNRIEHQLIHTGQHYDSTMSGTFFEGLEIPAPNVNLNVGSGTHAEQVGRTMIAFEKAISTLHPDWVIVVGDVNATLACAITAKKEGIKLAHVEAGLRSFDLTMPEEINRIVTDRLSDLLFTTDIVASENLRNEGAPEDRIKLVGNIMIDSLEACRVSAASLRVEDILTRNLIEAAANSPLLLPGADFAVVTLHRPSNVDDEVILSRIVRFLTDELSADLRIVWPVHPRTRDRLAAFGLWDTLIASANITLLKPLSYQELLQLNRQSVLFLTDSGGIQEECCVLGTPCLTLRNSTERPITLLDHGGASILVGNDVEKIRAGYLRILSCRHIQPSAPPLWDGKTASRIVGILANT